MTAPTIRPAAPRDAAAWLEMRTAFWPDGAEDHAPEIERYFAGELPLLAEVLLAFDDAGAAIGLAELSIRGYAEGCHSGRVGYLEGWYVVPDARRRGVGRALVDAALRWARVEGCTEFASDSALDNAASAAAHGALGFEEVDRIRCWRRDL